MSGAEPLGNERHERFANLVASGVTQEKAYVSAGYSEAGAKGSASRLRSHANIDARIAYLKSEVSKRTIEQAVVDRNYVLGGIKGIIEDPEAKHADRLRGLELIGKELGMFVQRVGDPEGASQVSKIEVEFVDASDQVGECVPPADAA